MLSTILISHSAVDLFDAQFADTDNVGSDIIIDDVTANKSEVLDLIKCLDCNKTSRPDEISPSQTFKRSRV